MLRDRANNTNANLTWLSPMRSLAPRAHLNQLSKLLEKIDNDDVRSNGKGKSFHELRRNLELPLQKEDVWAILRF